MRTPGRSRPPGRGGDRDLTVIIRPLIQQTHGQGAWQRQHSVGMLCATTFGVSAVTAGVTTCGATEQGTGESMATSKWASVAALAAACTLVLSACGNSDSSSTAGSSDGSGSKGKVGVILPDATTSPRWENNDRPSLTKAFDDAGIESDIQNAGGDTSKFGTICDSMINEGVKVLMIVNLDP